MESEKINEPEEKSATLPRGTVESEHHKWEDVDWAMRDNLLQNQFHHIYFNGTVYMKPYDVKRLYDASLRISSDKDPYVEMYYYRKMKEREQTPQELKRAGVVNFISYKEKEALAKKQLIQQIKKKLFAQSNSSLGIPETHTGRSQVQQLDVGIIMRDDDVSMEKAYLKVLASIELGWSSILKMELLSKKLMECTNEFEKIIIQHEQQKAKKNHLKAFYLDVKEDGSVDVKARWLIRVMSNRKGKKLFLQSYPFFNREIWLELLSYLIPYILIWCQQDEQEDVSTMVLKMITEYINSDFVDLAFITRIMEMFVKQK